MASVRVVTVADLLPVLQFAVEHGLGHLPILVGEPDQPPEPVTSVDLVDGDGYLLRSNKDLRGVCF